MANVVTSKQVAEATNKQPVTIRHWKRRYKGDFPVEIGTYGGTHVYDAAEMEEFLTAHGIEHRPLLETTPA